MRGPVQARRVRAAQRVSRAPPGFESSDSVALPSKLPIQALDRFALGPRVSSGLAVGKRTPTSRGRLIQEVCAHWSWLVALLVLLLIAAQVAWIVPLTAQIYRGGLRLLPVAIRLSHTWTGYAIAFLTVAMILSVVLAHVRRANNRLSFPRKRRR